MNSVAPDVQIDVAIQDPAWEEMPGIQSLVLTTVRTALQYATKPAEITDKNLEISILLANDDLIHILNREYRGKDNPTNILTFAAMDSGEEPMGPNTVSLGDVILSYQTIDREAREQGRFLQDHVTHLVVHGTLHLLGYDHIDDNEANNMESLEIRILEKLGVQNPYTQKITMS
jgi:probable rRNA maturation factor